MYGIESLNIVNISNWLHNMQIDRSSEVLRYGLLENMSPRKQQ